MHQEYSLNPLSDCKFVSCTVVSSRDQRLCDRQHPRFQPDRVVSMAPPAPWFEAFAAANGEKEFYVSLLGAVYHSEHIEFLMQKYVDALPQLLEKVCETYLVTEDILEKQSQHAATTNLLLVVFVDSFKYEPNTFNRTTSCRCS